MPPSKHDLRRYVKACDPNLPIRFTNQDKGLYVELDEVRADRHLPCVERLARRIERADPGDETAQLFTGHSGSGKTTELHRLRRHFEQDTEETTHVILIDMEEYLNRYQAVSIADVVRIFAYVFDLEASRLETGETNPKVSFQEMLTSWLPNSVEVKGAKVPLPGVDLNLEMKHNNDFRQLVNQHLRGRFQSFVAECHQVVSKAVSRIRRKLGIVRVVAMVDGLEKITASVEEDREAIEKSVEGLFLDHASLLRLPCHAIYTFPIWLQFRTAELGNTWDGDPAVLQMVSTHHPDGAPQPKGIHRMEELIRKRLGKEEDLNAVFANEGTLRLLVDATGGYPRDLLRLVRGLLQSLAESDFPAQESACAAAIRRLEQDYGRLIFDLDLPMLASVARTHQRPSDQDGWRRFRGAVERFLVLSYQNGKEWWDLHPLVRRSPLVAEAIKAAPPSQPETAAESNP